MIEAKDKRFFREKQAEGKRNPTTPKRGARGQRGAARPGAVSAENSDLGELEAEDSEAIDFGLSELESEAHDESLRPLVGIQFRRAAGVVYEFHAGELDLQHGDRVVVESDQGEELALVVGSPQRRQPTSAFALKNVLRVANVDDLARSLSNKEIELEALRWAAAWVRQEVLPMKMVAVQRALTGKQLTFFFAAEERADYRDLVKLLAQRYRCRIEMRHVSPRDEVKIIGAMGPCGRETCCSSWLRTFSPVTIQMAKDQGLSINPEKVTGVCGRLLCCLAFEQETYAELRRKLPRYGRTVDTPKGRGRVVDLYTLRGRVRVELENRGGFHEFSAEEVSPATPRHREESKAQGAAESSRGSTESSRGKGVGSRSDAGADAGSEAAGRKDDPSTRQPSPSSKSAAASSPALKVPGTDVSGAKGEAAEGTNRGVATGAGRESSQNPKQGDGREALRKPDGSEEGAAAARAIRSRLKRHKKDSGKAPKERSTARAKAQQEGGEGRANPGKSAAPETKEGSIRASESTQSASSEAGKDPSSRPRRSRRRSRSARKGQKERED